VPLVAAAFCPHPPLIVPQLAAGAAGELDDLREACDAALDVLWRSPARRVVVIGDDDQTREHFWPFVGSFAPWGVPADVRLGDGPPTSDPLPLSLLVGGWLIQNRRHPPSRSVTWTMYGVERRLPAADCAALLAHEQSHPWALLVMGDGAACHGPKAPGYDDPRAEPYDRVVAEALRTADTAALLGLDPVLSEELLVAGRAPWQVVAGAAAGARWRGDLLYDKAPYGVGYFVATWEPA
jgi:hypothetical protein